MGCLDRPTCAPLVRQVRRSIDDKVLRVVANYIPEQYGEHSCTLQVLYSLFPPRYHCHRLQYATYVDSAILTVASDWLYSRGTAVEIPLREQWRREVAGKAEELMSPETSPLRALISAIESNGGHAWRWTLF